MRAWSAWLVLTATALASPTPLIPLQPLREAEAHTDTHKEGPVVFPNDGPPPAPRPLVVTARPLATALARSGDSAPERPHFRPRKPLLLARLAQYRPLYPAPATPPKHNQKEPPPPAHTQPLPAQRTVDHSPQHDHGEEYAFSYSVRDQASGEDSFGHWERGRGGGGGGAAGEGAGDAAGAYRVRLPDGRVQTTSYTADHRGYRAQVTYHHPQPHPYDNNDFTVDNHLNHGGNDYKLVNHDFKTADDFKFDNDYKDKNSYNNKSPLDSIFYNIGNDYKLDNHDYNIGNDYKLDNHDYNIGNDYKLDNHDYNIGKDYKSDSDVYKVGDYFQSDNNDNIKFGDTYKDNYVDNYKLDNYIYKDDDNYKLDNHDNTKFGDSYKLGNNDFKENDVYKIDDHDNIEFADTFKDNNDGEYKLDDNVYELDNHDNIKFDDKFKIFKDNNSDYFKVDNVLKECNKYKVNHDNKVGDSYFANDDKKLSDNYKFPNDDYKLSDSYKFSNDDNKVDEKESGTGSPTDYSQEVDGHDYSLEQEPPAPHRSKYSQYHGGASTPSTKPLPTRYLVSAVARLRNGQPPQLSRSFIDRVNRYLTFT